MMRSPLLSGLALVGLLAVGSAPSSAEETTAAITNFKEAKSPLDFTATSLKGKEVHLADYRGKVVLIVNTASHCGFTPQYKGLQELYDSHKKDGLVVLGFPCNEFGRQEPGDSEEIMTFCKENYGVTFPMFSKIRVLGRRATPLYRYLSHPDTNGKLSGPIKWNFTKFLVGRDGKVVARFESRTAPEDEAFLKQVEAELAKKTSAVEAKG